MEDIIKAPIEPKRVRGMYDSLSRIYDYLTLNEGAQSEGGLKLLGSNPVIACSKWDLAQVKCLKKS